MPGTFNLLDEPWIPVLRNDGTVCSVGILQALEQAEHIRQIAASNPMDRVAVLRFLIALVYWCANGTMDAHEVMKNLRKNGFSKLKQHKECFNMLGDGKRFFQSMPPSYSPKRFKSVNYLIQEIPTGDNKWHFLHSTDSVDGLCIPCCALGLLRLPPFAPSGGRGLSPGINFKPPIYMLPMGLTLYETLRRTQISFHTIGVPSWEIPDQTLPMTGEVPLLLGLTWLPRRVWLQSPTSHNDRCILCGRTAKLIYECVFDGVGSTKPKPNEPEREWRDPHVLYEADGKSSIHAENMLKHPESASLSWTKVMKHVLNVLSYGCDQTMYHYSATAYATVDNNKDLEANELNIRSSVDSALRDSLIDSIEKWEKESTCLFNKLSKIRPNKHKLKQVWIKQAIATMSPHLQYDALEAYATALTTMHNQGFAINVDTSALMNALAHSLAPGATTHAIERRREIMKAAPRMAGDHADAVDSTRNKPTKGDAR